MHLNWGAIQNDWSAGMAKVDQIVAQEAQRIKAHAAEMGAAIAAAMKGEALPSKKGGGLEMPKAGGNFDYQPSDGGSKKKKKEGMSLPERLEAELENRKKDRLGDGAGRPGHFPAIFIAERGRLSGPRLCAHRSERQG
jgi:hypothetical protein